MTNTVKGTTLVRFAAIGCLALALIVFSRRSAVRAAQGNQVQIVESGRRLEGNPGERGTTYYALEAQTTRFTTRFQDGTMATAERSIDGNVRSRLEDPGGNEINRLNVGHNVLTYVRPSADPVQAVPDSGVHATLDWSNRQSHRLHEDRVVSSGGLEWRDGLIRRAGSRGKDEERTTVREVETQWANGLSARTARLRPKPGDKFEGRIVQGEILVTKLMRGGVEVGLANYLTDERIYVWSIPGMTEGTLDNDHLKTRYAGWPFTPDMVWMNLQTIALYHWKTTINEKGFVARCHQPAPNPVVQFFMPTLSANEPGCDDFHWLDGSVLRFCCDVHDYCYEKNGCNSKSWWQVWNSWRCDYCNAVAIQCFSTGGVPGTRLRRPPE